MGRLELKVHSLVVSDLYLEPSIPILVWLPAMCRVELSAVITQPICKSVKRVEVVYTSSRMTIMVEGDLKRFLIYPVASSSLQSFSA